MNYFWVAVGGALGSVARYWCSIVAAEWIGGAFPWGTLIVNVIGSFVIGFFATLTEPDGRIFASSEARIFVMVGICGGFTTFSAFSFQTLALAREADWLGAGLNVVLSLVLCLVAVWLGYIAALGLNK
jgi:fluoride exporter